MFIFKNVCAFRGPRCVYNRAELCLPFSSLLNACSFLGFVFSDFLQDGSCSVALVFPAASRNAGVLLLISFPCLVAQFSQLIFSVSEMRLSLQSYWVANQISPPECLFLSFFFCSDVMECRGNTFESLGKLCPFLWVVMFS